MDIVPYSQNNLISSYVDVEKADFKLVLAGVLLVAGRGAFLGHVAVSYLN